MDEDIIIEPMTEEFIVWRCLHGGPLSHGTIDQLPSESDFPWDHYRNRNMPFLMKLTKTYGACAIITRNGDKVVGFLRFYPKAVCDMVISGGLCLQQDYPAGPADDAGESDFPDLAQIDEKTLVVHCLMTGCSSRKENPYQRKGIGTRMVKTLINWGKAKGWEHIEADSFEDIPIIYEITGSAGHTFWEKLGFHVADRYPHPYLQNREQFVLTLEEQAESMGISAERARDLLVMRLSLT